MCHLNVKKLYFSGGYCFHCYSILYEASPVVQHLISYLSNRTQHIQGQKVKSSPSLLTHGVPQGSVLGSVLFIIYILVFIVTLMTLKSTSSLSPTLHHPPTALTSYLQAITNTIHLQAGATHRSPLTVQQEVTANQKDTWLTNQPFVAAALFIEEKTFICHLYM